MPKSFKSITQRLIFGFVVSAIAIDGVSYWQARQLMKNEVDPWVIPNQITTFRKTGTWHISLFS